ncbi:hypothetical protein AX769_17655 [Frondihabitans sp. PAMC 28766]|uniref:TetR/AcrR family transcriptional regulator n=1 Tax=Frondihabitans sp. PAMC 28766 TaxID=1795630 RepID=UPI00078C2927|nr:TetR/AcrR family transcriptional regulator [Frondihabitans sp. PAMC 28766]AMM21632.1 hypothetical protein AX769_17655 [Frondihabitans sp. PAMC 28766]
MGRRDEIIEAALQLSEEIGVDRVSMRMIGDRLGTSAMALYRHLPNRDGLLDALVGRVLSEVHLPDRSLDWATRLHSIAHALLDVAIARPGVFRLVLERSYVAPEAIGVMDEMYAVLRDAGVDESMIPRVERMLSTALLGFAVTVSNGGFWDGQGAQSGAMNPSETRWAGELDQNVDDMVRMIRDLGLKPE